MIDAQFPISLNGVKYRIAEDSEGDSYLKARQPLRPQNSALVQGTDTTTFNVRPDTLLWSWTNWSGGEGTFRYDPETAASYWRGEGIDPFTRPGSLRLGHPLVNTFRPIPCYLVQGPDGKLYAVSEDDNEVHLFDEGGFVWGSAIVNPFGTTGVGASAAIGDGTFLYYKEDGSADIFRYDGTTWLLLNDDTGITGNQSLVEQGAYLYITKSDGKLYEIPKFGTPPTTSTIIHDFGSNSISKPSSTNDNTLTVGDDRIYRLIRRPDTSIIIEILPTTAAGPGYGFVHTTIPGFEADSIWYSHGFIYIIGRDITSTTIPSEGRGVIYIQADGTWGTLGRLRPDEAFEEPLIGSSDGNRMLQSHFVTKDLADDVLRLWAVEAVTGGVACVGFADFGAGTGVIPLSVFHYQGQIFISCSKRSGILTTIYRTKSDAYVGKTSGVFVESSMHDFGISADKLLMSMHMTHAPLPVNYVLDLQYQVDEDGVWVTAVTQATDDSTSTNVVFSSTITFRTLRLRLDITTTFGDGPTTPEIYAIDARCAVAEQVNVWSMNLDLSDELGDSANRSLGGVKLIDNIVTAAAVEGIVVLEDGYRDRLSGKFTSHNVIIDSYNIVLDRPGEGYAQVILREVS